MDKKNRIVRVGYPGKFDPVFGLMPYYHFQLMEPLWIVVWLDTGEPVVGLGGFENPITAENYIKDNRAAILDKEIENILLVNK